MADRLDIANIFVNFLKKARYERLIAEDELEEDQFYATTDGNEKTEYGDLFGNIEDQADLFNALYSSRIFIKAMCDDPRGYAIVKALKESALIYDLAPCVSIVGEINDYVNYNGTEDNHVLLTFSLPLESARLWINTPLVTGTTPLQYIFSGSSSVLINSNYDESLSDLSPVSFNILIDCPLDGEWRQLPLIETSANSENVKVKLLAPMNLTQTKYGIGTFIMNKIPLATPSYRSGQDTYPLYNITIPYIESRDGVKIVDVQYKDLVDQLYDLTGQGNYIIIDEANEEFRLPLPDIYSQLENKSSFILRKWED